MIAVALWIATVPKQSVTFSLVAPDAKDVLFAGDLCGWSTPKHMVKDRDRWTIKFDVPQDARIEYKFIVDGKWITDPTNPKKYVSIGENSVYEGPKYEFHADDATPVKPLIRQLLNVGGRSIIVYKPEDSAGLPMLVYGDGENYEAVGKVQNVIANLVEAKKIRPVILVLIPPVDRMKEYGRGWKEYADHLFNDWLPAVRQATGASSEAKDLYVGGSSMGGVISLRLAEEYPDKVAGGVHSQSGAFLYDSPLIDFHELSDPSNLKKVAKGTRLWFCWGNFEGSLTTANEKLARTLKALKMPFGTKTTDDGHTWTAWRSRMKDALVYLLKP